MKSVKSKNLLALLVEPCIFRYAQKVYRYIVVYF